MTANILIVTDVQNCWMDGNKRTALINEIADMVNAIPFDYYVLSRDVHPRNHVSHMVTTAPNTTRVRRKNGTQKAMNIKTAYQGSPAVAAPGFESVDLTGGLWTPHCIETKYKHIGTCKPRVDQGEVTIANATQTDNCKSDDTLVSLVPKFANPDITIELADDAENHFNEPNKATYQVTVTSLPPTKPVIQVLKGQLCNWDAYSAFQYHIKNGMNQKSDLSRSTGLAEVMFSKELGITKFRPDAKKVNIVICGFAGEYAVKYTMSYGLSTVIDGLKQGLQGYTSGRIRGYPFLMTPAPIPPVHFIYSAYGTQFLPRFQQIAEIRNTIKSTASHKPKSVRYSILLPPQEQLLDSISVGGSANSSMRSVTDALKITKVGGGQRKTRRRK